MHDHDIRAIEHRIQIEQADIVEVGAEPGIRAPETSYRGEPVLRDQIGEAPGAARLVHFHALAPAP